MVTLYVGGQKVDWADAEKVFSNLSTKAPDIEFRNDAGKVVARVVPERRIDPTEPLIPWEPDITQEEIDRRMSEPGFTFDEVKKRLGWE